MNHMPSDLGQFLLATDDAHKMIIYDCLDQLWHDAMKAASILREGRILQDEFNILWKSLSADQQKQIEELVAAKNCESANDQRLMGQLKQVTRQIFQPAFEISIVRPLCIQLD